MWVESDVESLVIKTVELIAIIVYKWVKFTGGEEGRMIFRVRYSEHFVVELFLDIIEWVVFYCHSIIFHI